MKVAMKDIKIPGSFKRTKPSAEKVNKKKEQYLKTGQFKKLIVLSSDHLLTDGYINYLVLEELGAEFAECEDVEFEKDMYIYGSHINDVNSEKIYVWKVPKNKKELFVNIKTGDTVIVDTKYGYKPVQVISVAFLDSCPVNTKIKKVIRKGDN